MLHELTISGLPRTPDSLAWSEAGDLCVAIAGRVNLFIPNTKVALQKAIDPALQPWSNITFEVNSFTPTEWPFFEQRSFADFSVGEEESENHVVSCSWSAPGLAEHERCLLGVLTSAGLFSFWDVNGDPALATSWRRTVVINNQLRMLLPSFVHEETTIGPKHLRIRAASWAQRLPSSENVSPGRRSFLLSLLNDLGEVILVTVERLGGKQLSELYSIKVAHILNIQRSPASIPDGMLDRLQWSAWTREDGLCSAILSCSTENYDWDISVGLKDDHTSKIELVCETRQLQRRKVPDWDVRESQSTLSSNKYLNHKLTMLKKTWETEIGEGQPCFVRSYGLGTYKEYQAVHVSFHPRDVIEYFIQAREWSYVIFSHVQLKHSLDSANNVTFDWEETVSDSDGSALPWDFILARVPDIQIHHTLGGYASICLTVIRLYLVFAFFKGWELDRTTQIMQKLVGDQRIVDEEILQRIEEDREEFPDDEALQRIESVIDSFLDLPNGLESCSICNTRLFWHGERAVRCQQGHQFDRCSLTLLAIQEPGISKFCSSCNREYLDEKKQFFREDDQDASPFRDFLLQFFRKFSRCIYCGATVQSFI